MQLPDQYEPAYWFQLAFTMVVQGDCTFSWCDASGSDFGLS